MNISEIFNILFYYIKETFNTWGYSTVKIIIILILTLVVGSRLKNYLQKILLSYYPDQLVISLLTKTIYYVILFIAGTMIAQEMGLNISALLAAAGVFGVAIGFAAQTSFANIISGIFLIIEKPFNKNDYISLGDIQGTVSTINLFAITLTTSTNAIIRIPHEKILKNVIVNYSTRKRQRYDIIVPLSAEQDFTKISKIILDVVSKNQYALSTPDPLIRIDAFKPGQYVNLHIGVWTQKQQVQDLKNTLLLDLQKAFVQNNISIASNLLNEEK